MYEKKIQGERPDRVEQMERSIMLQAIDKLWQQHITDMDALREGVRLRAQGQRDPLVEYKREQLYGIFEELMRNVQFEILNNLFRSTTNLSAFEDFLASLPTSNAAEEDSDVSDILGNGDLLSALREQLGLIHQRQQQVQEQNELTHQPEVTADLLAEEAVVPDTGSASGALVPGLRLRPEKKLHLPRKKVTRFAKEHFGQLAEDVSTGGEAGVEQSETLGSMDSASVFVPTDEQQSQR